MKNLFLKLFFGSFLLFVVVVFSLGYWLSTLPRRVQDAPRTCGYINSSGKYVIPPQFKHAEQFKEGLALTDRGYINQTGRVAIPGVQPESWRNAFSEGLLAIKRNGQGVRFIDRTGRVVLHFPKAVSSEPFSDGYSIIRGYATPEAWAPMFSSAIINKKGQILVSARDRVSYSDCAEGLCVMRIWKPDEERYGYINPQTGKVVIKPEFEKAHQFSEGLSSVKIHKGLYGYINKTGRFVIPPKFIGADNFREGVAEVYDGGGKYGYINKKGKYLIPPILKWHSWPSEGLIAVESEDKLHGFMDLSGKIVIPYKYKYAASFSEGLAAVTLDGNLWGFIDKRGKLVIPPRYAQLSKFSEGLTPVCLKTLSKH
jgi:hypothetical protein